jgi:5'-3' exonuclease
MEHVLLIDGKNTAYRALFAARGNPEFRNSKQHPFVVWLRFAHVWLEKFKPSECHVFWDCPKNDVWRKRVLTEYKDHRETMHHYDDDVQDQMRELISAATDILPHFGVRQYLRPNQECDDLIYAACKCMTPSRTDSKKVVVVSSDSDFLQLQWSMPHVVCYLPKDGKLAERPDCDPAVQKALCGDKADNIDGYRGIGPVKSRQLVSDGKKLFEFLDSESIDEKKFRRNLALIDLSLNPSTLSNQIFIMRKMAEPVEFNKSEINRLGMEHKVVGLMPEYTRVGVSFKKLS